MTNFFKKKNYISIIVIKFFIFSVLGAQEPISSKDTEIWSSKPPLLTQVDMNWNRPTDAIVLLDDKITAFTKKDGKPMGWTVQNGIMTVKPDSGNVYSSYLFEDCHLHIEWRSPSIVLSKGQNRGNSGVFLQERYEVQILDSYENETYYNGQAGSIYKIHPPLANVTSKPGEWNTFDIIYKAPKFDTFGKNMEYGVMTVIHNGVVIQNNATVYGTTENVGYPKNPMHRGGRIMLQDHGCLVSFRNIWIRRI